MPETGVLNGINPEIILAINVHSRHIYSIESVRHMAAG